MSDGSLMPSMARLASAHVVARARIATGRGADGSGGTGVEIATTGTVGGGGVVEIATTAVDGAGRGGGM